MDAPIVRELRVEGRPEDAALPDENRVSPPTTENLDFTSESLDPWGANKYPLETRGSTKLGGKLDFSDR